MKIIKNTAPILIGLVLWSCNPEVKEKRTWFIQDESRQIGQQSENSTAEVVPAAVEAKVEKVSDAPVDLGGIGLGPITSVELAEELDMAMVEKGKATFKTLCRSCHKLGNRFVGPPLGDVLSRRRPEWVLNMMMNPEQMVSEDPVAKALLEEYISPMANQNVTEEQGRNILEYIREYQKRKSQEG